MNRYFKETSYFVEEGIKVFLKSTDKCESNDDLNNKIYVDVVDIQKETNALALGHNKKTITGMVVLNYLQTENRQYYFMTNIIKLLAGTLEKLGLEHDLIANTLLYAISISPRNLCETSSVKTSYDLVDVIENYYPFKIEKKLMQETAYGNPLPLINFLGKTHLNKDKFKMDYEGMFSDIRKIQDNYTLIKDSFTEINILNVLDAFLSLGVSLDIAEIIEAKLFKILDKNRNKPVEIIKPIKKKNNMQETNKKYITDKEYKSILKEIRKYYNPYTREVTNEFISPEMREYIAYLMIKIGLDKETISDFLRKTDEENKMLNYSYFKDHVEEFIYYYQDQVSDAVEYLKEINSSNRDTDNAYWIAGIDDVLRKLPLDGKIVSYEYEIMLLKRK